MSINPFKRLIQQGASSASDHLSTSRIRLINTLLMFSIVVSMGLIASSTYFRVYDSTVINTAVAFVLLFFLYINRRGNNLLAATLYVNFCGLAILGACYIAFRDGRYTETENMLYVFMGVSIFLFDGRRQSVQYLILFLELIMLKFFKWDFQGLINSVEFNLTLINVAVVALGLYFFLSIFKMALLKSLKETKENQNILFSMIDNVPIFMSLEGRNRRFKMVNKQYVREFNMAREDIIGARSEDVLPDYIWQNHTKYLDRAFAGEHVEFLEKAKLPNGKRLHASGKFVPIKNAKGQVEFVTVYVDDVTKLKEVEEQLKVELKDKDKLFSIIAHDIRSPLNLFEGLLNASDNDIISQEEFLVFKENLRERFYSLQETINSLLEWSRLQLDRIQPSPELISPHKLIHEILTIFKPIAETKKIALVHEESNTGVTMDKNHFKIIFRNLIHNALKFTPNGGQITISYSSGDSFMISVSDTGVGMSEEAIRKVLSKEDMTSTTGTMGETGTGLGLNLSLELLEKNGGAMDIQRGGGGGTKFLISIPVLSDQLSAELTSAATA